MSPTRHRLSVALKLHSVAALTFVAVLALASASVHFANETKGAVALLRDDGIVGNNVAAQLELLLQQHRRAVESAPAELDRERLSATRRLVLALDGKLSASLTENDVPHDASGPDDATDALLAQLRRELPELIEAESRVLELAFNLVQDQALEASQGPYAAVADRMQNQITQWRDERTRILDAQVSLLAINAATLVSRVYRITIFALLLGMAGVAVTRGVLIRLERVKCAMLRLASRDTSVDVPLLEHRDEIGDMANAVQVFKQNATELLVQTAALQRSSLRFETALSNMSQGLCQYDPDDRLDVFNERFCSIYGLDAGRLRPGLTFSEVVHMVADTGNQSLCAAEQIVAERMAWRRRSETSTVVQELANGRVVSISLCPMQNGGWVATYEDVTDRRRSQERLSHMARHDALTGLPNRVLLREHMEDVLLRVRAGGSVAVLYLDLDGFKGVNDSLGHPAGDELLRLVARRLHDSTREEDLVARLGGDEFAIVQMDAQQPMEAASLADRLVRVLGMPFDVQGQLIVIGTSVGVVLADQATSTPDELLRSADIALYRAKAGGRGIWKLFEPSMDAQIQQRRALETDLRRAAAEGQFELYYQPLVRARTQVLSGFEALLRWNHPERGLVSPAEFIPIAEELGLIRTMGAWILGRACADAMRWPEHMKVAVNLSPLQFVGGNLLREVEHALEGSCLPPNRLELEITESVLLQDNDATLDILHRLRGLGVRISMDDFGTGYSSLSYLRRFPFDKIKIDQSFVRNLEWEKGGIEIIRAVVSLGKALSMEVLAEGVETAEQFEMLQREGCDELQGYLFSQPKPLHDVPWIIEAHLPGSVRACATMARRPCAVGV